MAKKSNKSTGLSDGEKVGIGVALTTAAVAAAGAYFLYGSPNAAKNRKKVKGWALKAKGEVLEMLEKAGHLTAEEYQMAVDKIAAGYSKLQAKPEVDAFRKEMMAYWKQISKNASGAKKAVKKSAKKAVKTTKKAAKKK